MADAIDAAASKINTFDDLKSAASNKIDQSKLQSYCPDFGGGFGG